MCKFETTARIAKVSDCENSRYALGCVQITPGTDNHVWLTATDGCVLAIRQESGTTATETLCPAKIFPTTQRGQVTRLESPGRWENSQGKVSHDIPQGIFPSCVGALPAVNHEDYLRVELDCKRLYNLALALAGPNPDTLALTLYFPRPSGGIDGSANVIDRPIGVCGARGNIGCIMPRVNDRGHDAKQLDDYQTQCEAYRAAKTQVQATPAP